MERKRFTLDLTDNEFDYWRRLAAACGFYIGRGTHAKQGSIQKLFEAAASGEVKIRAERQLTIES